MKELWAAILETWLPSKWPRLIMASAISLSLGTLIPLSWLQTVGITPTQEEMSLARTVGIPWLLLAALAASHFLILWERRAFENLKNWKFHSKVNLQAGEYYDVVGAKNNRLMRIVLKDISVKSMPPQHEHLLEEDSDRPDNVDREVVTLSIEYNSVHPGSFVKKFIKQTPYVEEYYALGVNKYDEEDNSVFFFRTMYGADCDEFFRCFVEHINPQKKEAELNIYYLWLKKA